MKILIVGGGGREHALTWALSKDRDVEQVYAAPGNPGIAEIGTCIPIASNNSNELGPPWVIKADGLAAGKGTTVTRDRREAEAAIQRELLQEPKRIVMEEFIDGWEASFTATVSANRVQWLAPVFQDYKPAFDGDS